MASGAASNRARYCVFFRLRDRAFHNESIGAIDSVCLSIRDCTEQHTTQFCVVLINGSKCSAQSYQHRKPAENFPLAFATVSIGCVSVLDRKHLDFFPAFPGEPFRNDRRFHVASSGGPYPKGKVKKMLNTPKTQLTAAQLRNGTLRRLRGNS